MHDSRDLDAKKGPPWQDSRAMYPKSPDCTTKRIHGTKILPASARKACISRKRCQGDPFFVQSAKKGYMARESCHSSQSNLEDRHNKSIGRQNANQKKDPGTTAKSPNTKATPTRPLFWQPEATLKSTCHQGGSRKGANPRSMKQLARQLSTKDP